VVGEEVEVQDDGPEEAAELSGAAAGGRIRHGRPSLSIEGGRRPSIGGEEVLLVYPLGSKGFTTPSVPFVSTPDVTTSA
jgi:hypothetical protein